MKSEVWLRVILWSTSLLFLMMPIHVESLKCYQCGVDGTPPCHAFELASTWRPFEVDCPPDNICVKTVSNNGGTVRGCGAERVASGDKWSLTCEHGNAHLSSTLICMCNTHLCNSAVKALPELTSLVVLSTVTVFCFERFFL